MLRDYQLKAIDFISKRNAIIALDCGMGKTVTAIKAVENDMQGLVLWLCRKSAVTQIIDEIKQWGNSNTNVINAKDFIAISDSIESNMLYHVVTYYDQLQTLPLDNFYWDWIIADEGHALRNHRTKRHEKLMTFSSRRRIALTATPAKKAVGYVDGNKMSALHPKELYGILHFLYPNQFSSNIKFLEQFWQPIRWDGIIINYNTYMSILSNIIYVESGNISHGLPELNFVKHYISLSNKEQQLYNELRKQAAADIVINIEELKDLSLITSKAVLFTRLQQLTSMPELLGASDILPSKIQWLDDNIESLIESGVVIMTRFVDTAKFIADRYKIALHAGTTRASIVHGKTTAIVGTAASMGESLNFWWLRNLVLYDQIWSGNHRLQAISRIRRLKGGNSPKFVFELIANKTIDEYIRQYSLDSAIPLTVLKELLYHIKEV